MLLGRGARLFIAWLPMGDPMDPVGMRGAGHTLCDSLSNFSVQSPLGYGTGLPHTLCLHIASAINIKRNNLSDHSSLVFPIASNK